MEQSIELLSILKQNERKNVNHGKLAIYLTINKPISAYFIFAMKHVSVGVVECVSSISILFTLVTLTFNAFLFMSPFSTI